MKKLGLGTIGTSWITDSFIEAALKTNQYNLVSVYSRTDEKGRRFADKYGNIPVQTDLDAFMNNEEVDVVYIASPNSLHYEQSLLALKAKKHVITEKPASTSVEQWDDLLETAEENRVFVFEAARHLHSPNLPILADAVGSLGEIKGATLSYMRYSSKYDQVRAGREPNVFSLDFAGGALMDLGIYPIYTAVYLFGKPQSTNYFARKLHTGVDGMGTVILHYETFDVTILIGKTATSKIGGEIYGEEDTLILDHVSDLGSAYLMNQKTYEEQKVPFVVQDSNTMIYEAEAFGQMIQEPDGKETLTEYKNISDIARTVSGILVELRNKADIHFT